MNLLEINQMRPLAFPIARHMKWIVRRKLIINNYIFIWSKPLENIVKVTGFSAEAKKGRVNWISKYSIKKGWTISPVFVTGSSPSYSSGVTSNYFCEIKWKLKIYFFILSIPPVGTHKHSMSPIYNYPFTRIHWTTTTWMSGLENITNVLKGLFWLWNCSSM